MADSPYIFPAGQADFLRAFRQGRYRAPERDGRHPARVSLAEAMPPVYQQALQGTCVASAVTALLEYYCDCKLHLSVQFLHAATKEFERVELLRNLSALRAGEPLSPVFETAFHAELLSLRMLAHANGGFASAEMEPYLLRFEEGLRTHFSLASGCLLQSCFRTVETQGTCRHALWPSAAARATPVFGLSDAAAFPPGTREDARKHRVANGLYLLGTPNNVDEIRGILAGANARRAMPVVVTVDFFAGCDGETYALPAGRDLEDGRLASEAPYQGRHALLIVGYEDDAKAPGGGFFVVRNSLGEEWGARGYGRVPYAYVECFAVEAGTILQDLVDYAGDDYDGRRKRPTPPRRLPRWAWWTLNILIALAVAALTLFAGVLFHDPLGLHKNPPSDPAGGPRSVAAEPPAGTSSAGGPRAVAAEPPACTSPAPPVVRARPVPVPDHPLLVPKMHLDPPAMPRKKAHKAKTPLVFPKVPMPSAAPAPASVPAPAPAEAEEKAVPQATAARPAVKAAAGVTPDVGGDF